MNLKRHINIYGSLLILGLCSAVFSNAGGLYNEIISPIDSGAKITQHERAARMEIDNTYREDGTATITFVTEKIKFFPGEAPLTKFKRRTVLTMPPTADLSIPYLNPQTGEQIGTNTLSPASVYAVLYSLWVYAEKDQDTKDAAALIPSAPAVVEYTTNGPM